MKINSKDLNKLLEQVTEDVVGILAKSDESSMAKADPGEETPGEETPAGSSAEGSTPEATPEGPPSEGPEGSAGDQEAPSGPEAPSDGSEQNPAEDESAGPEALVAEYSKLPIEELKLHVMAAHAALMQAIGSSGEGDQGEQPSPEGEAGPGPGTSAESTPPAGIAEPPMGKAEVKSSPGNGGQVKVGGGVCKSELEVKLEKLEKAISDKDATIRSLEEKMTEAVAGLNNLVSKSKNVALRKSVAGIAYEGKPGSEEKSEVVLSKSEALAKCNELSMSKDLSKSDKEKIMSFVLGHADQSTISHLLSKK
jgi:hypothetical protein